MYFVYAVYNRVRKKFYIGQTQNLKERLKLHNNKIFKGSYTSKLSGEWELIYKEKVLNRKSALIREKQLKSYQGRLFIHRLLEKVIPR